MVHLVYQQSLYFRVSAWHACTKSVLRADFERAVKVFIPRQAHPKSAHHLSLAFGGAFRGCWLPAARAQYSVPVVEELCAAAFPGRTDVWKTAWVYRNWLGNYSHSEGANVPEAHRPAEPPVASAEAVCCAGDARKLVDVLLMHMEELARYA